MGERKRIRATTTCAIDPRGTGEDRKTIGEARFAWKTTVITYTVVMGVHRNFSREGQGLEGHDERAEREPITGILVGAPMQWRPGVELLVGAKRPEVESFAAFVRLKEGQTLCC